jgi:hypothetical protein
MSYRAFSMVFWRRLSRICLVAALVFVSSYCTDRESQTEIEKISEDEAYLVDTYVKLVQARDAYSVSYFKSESLFALIDSTTDSLRIANTIRQLNLDPDRWVLIFRNIEQAMDTVSQGSQGKESEQRR